MEYNRLMTTFGLSVAASAIVSLLSGFVGHLVGLIFVKESIVVFAFRDILRRITRLREFIVNETQFTSLFPGGDAVQANVELGAIRGVSVFWMGIRDAKSIFGRQFGTRETIFKATLMCSFAIGPLGLGGPVADTTELVEPQPGRASVFFCHPLNAGVKDIANAGVRMGVESVQPRAEIIGTFGRLEFQAITAVHVEIMITRLSFVAEGVKNEAVRTQSLFGDAVVAFIVLVTLPSVFKRSVGFGTIELARGHGYGQCHKEDTHGVESGAFFKLLIPQWGLCVLTLLRVLFWEAHTHFRVWVAVVVLL